MNKSIAEYYSENILKEACELYKLDSASATLIRDNSNLVFDCGTKILRLTHAHVRSYEEIAAELAFLDHLLNAGVAVAAPVKSIHERQLEQVGGEAYFIAVCFVKIEGSIPTEKEWNESFFERLGALNAQLHLKGKEYLAKTTYTYPSWDEIPEHFCSEYLKTPSYNYQDLYTRVIEKLQHRSPEVQAYGIVHYDIHHGNYLLTQSDQKIVLFDFEMCCRARWIDDIATTLYYADRHPDSRQIDLLESTFYQAFKRGYEKYLPILEEEEKSIPIYLLYRDLMVLGFVNKAWEMGELNAVQQRYLNRLLTSIEKRSLALGE